MWHLNFAPAGADWPACMTMAQAVQDRARRTAPGRLTLHADARTREIHLAADEKAPLVSLLVAATAHFELKHASLERVPRFCWALRVRLSDADTYAACRILLGQPLPGGPVPADAQMFPDPGEYEIMLTSRDHEWLLTRAQAAVRAACPQAEFALWPSQAPVRPQGVALRAAPAATPGPIQP